MIPPPAIHHSLPLWLKIIYTLFICVLVPVYWPTYGPANFLWFCDFALMITGVALWLESPLLASMQAIAMTLAQTLWICDFITGGHLVGISSYMFKSEIPLYVRGLSTFHIWLPVLLLWLVWRLGYDRRAIWAQSALTTALLIACYLLTNPANPPMGYPDAAVNVNRVYGLREATAQTWVPPLIYLLMNLIFYPLCLYLPEHLLFKRIFRQPIIVSNANGLSASVVPLTARE